MVGQLADGRSLPGEVVDHIVAKSDGVPLYVEELTKAILGSGVLEARGDIYVLTGALAQLHIPETLQDSRRGSTGRRGCVKWHNWARCWDASLPMT